MDGSSIEEICVCILGADDRESILASIASARRYGLPVHIGVSRRRELLEVLDGVSQHLIDWKDDFAAARNQILAEVHSRFVLWMDSDEVLVSFGAIDWQGLLGDLHGLRLQACACDLPRTSVRIHRNVPQVRWTGRIHERLTWCGEMPTPFPRLLPGIALVHSGYDDPLAVKVKNDRNVAIASAVTSLAQMSLGELVSLARSEAAYGRFNIMFWLQLFRHGEQQVTPYYDSRWESAQMLLAAGHAAPARALLRVNPLIVPLQLGMLADGLRRTGSIDANGLDHLALVLGQGLFDAQYPFPLALIRGDHDVIAQHVRAMADEWMESRKTMTNQPVAAIDRHTTYRRSDNVEAESFEDDLILMHGATWQAVALNGVAAALWEALAWPQTPIQLAQLLQEAAPGRPAAELAAQVDSALTPLLNHGFIEAQFST